KKARQGYEVVVADLICAGTEGLLDAPKCFRLDAGASFKTAASKSIEKEIRAEARRLRQAVKVPEDKNLPWYSSLTSYDDYVNEYQGETDVAVDGFAYQPEDAAINADSADATPPGQEFNRTTRDFACLADLDRAANSLKDKRERDIFRARYIAGKTLKAIASKYRTGFQRVSKIARAA